MQKELEVRLPMVSATYFLECQGDSHKDDAKVAVKVRLIKGIKEVGLQPGFKFDGKIYCIVAYSDVKTEEERARIREDIKKITGYNFKEYKTRSIPALET